MRRQRQRRQRSMRHLDVASILEDNAKSLAEARSRPETFCGPQMTQHRKPNAGGGPCDVCGANGLRLGVLHAALPALHGHPRARFIVYAMDWTHDWSERGIDWEGRPA